MPPRPSTPASTEAARLQVLGEYGLADGTPEPVFHHLVNEAAALLGCPSAAVTLITADRCLLPVQIGLGVTDVPRSFGLCGYAFCSSGTFILEDASQVAAFKDVPLVAQVGFRFYIGVPLVSPEGHALGTLCVLDRAPHHPTSAQITQLQTLAHRVMDAMERRRHTRQAARSARHTVLVVDDESSIRTFVCSIFEHRGIRALAAANGLEALDQFRAHADNIGLVLTDLQMPGMNGLDLIDALQREAHPPTVAVMSGRLEPSTEHVLAAKGITCVLAKPFPLAAFDRLTALLPRAVVTQAP